MRLIRNIWAARPDNATLDLSGSCVTSSPVVDPSRANVQAISVFALSEI